MAYPDWFPSQCFLSLLKPVKPYSFLAKFLPRSVFSRQVCLFLLLLLLAVVSQSANAEKQKFQAALSIVQPVQLVQSAGLDYGALRLKPGSSCYLNPKSGETQGDACFEQSGQAARLMLSADPADSIGIAVTVPEGSALAFIPELNVQPVPRLTEHSREQIALEIGGKLEMPVAMPDQSVEKPAPVHLAYAVEIVYP